jgi:hypothetical protein
LTALNKGRGVLIKAIELASVCGVNESLYAAPHPHPQETAMRHVEDVEKKGFYTSKQALKHKQKPKHTPTHKPSCAALEKATSQKRKIAVRRL